MFRALFPAVSLSSIGVFAALFSVVAAGTVGSATALAADRSG
jgi:hypothetical protein